MSPAAEPLHVLFVCTANRCRSPMAQVLLEAAAARRGVDGVTTSSAGRLPSDEPAIGGAVRTMAKRGLDLGAHASTRFTPDVGAGAQLIVGMAREHVREVVVSAPNTFSRTFTLKELIRRGEAYGPRGAGQSLEEWLAAVSEGRTTGELLGDDARDDVADPIGLPDAEFERTAVELEDLIERLVALLFPAGQAGGSPAS